MKVLEVRQYYYSLHVSMFHQGYAILVQASTLVNSSLEVGWYVTRPPWKYSMHMQHASVSLGLNFVLNTYMPLENP